METIAVIDFETTGLPPNRGDRATEIAAVLVRDGQIVDHYAEPLERGPVRRFCLTAVAHERLGRIQRAPRGQLERCVTRNGKGCASGSESCRSLRTRVFHQA